jgi:hypothetical protein
LLQSDLHFNFYAFNFGWVYSAQKVFAEMSGQSVASWLTFIQKVLINTYGWEVYTSLSLDLCKTYAFSDASKYCIFSDYSQAWLQLTELICIELQQVLFLKQLGCSQSNHVKSRSSTKYTTIQIIQLIATAVTACGGINTSQCARNVNQTICHSWKKHFDSSKSCL